MGTYELIVSTIMSGLSQNVTDDPVIQSISKDEVGVLLNEVLQSNGITSTNIPSSKMLWIRLKVMEQIYWKLALSSAPLYDITMDGMSVKRKDRFEHYLKLIDSIGKSLASMEKDDPTLGGATLKTYDTYVDKVYNHNSYVTAQNIPVIEVILDTRGETYCNLSLDLRECRNAFLKYDIYYGDTSIIDPYNDYSINKEATLLKQECNIHNNKLRVPISEGYVACVVTLKNGLKAYHELKLGGDDLVTT